MTGAILAALSLLLMPLAPAFGAPLLFAAALLWVLAASLNISMEPFRAFVGDMLDKSQHATGYAGQTAFIGAGAVVAAIFPWLLEQFGAHADKDRRNAAAPMRLGCRGHEPNQ